MILSTAATRTIEQVADALGDGDRWFQLYWPRREFEDITASLLSRAQSSGFDALVVTLDTFVLGWRPVDLDTAYLPFIWGQGCAIGLTDPVFQKRYEDAVSRDDRGVVEKMKTAFNLLLRPGTPTGALRVLRNLKTMQKSQMWLDVMNSGAYRDWDDLKILRKLWGPKPIVLKGIQTVEDALKAIEMGIDGIIVSNHGGRQLDGAVASLDALEMICSNDTVKNSNLTVLFDSGVRSGTDVLKAMCLGAKGVLIGRPYMYGLAMGGEAGVKHVLDCLLGEFDNALGQMGKRSVRELGRDDISLPSEVAKL